MHSGILLRFQDALEQIMACLYIISPHSTAFAARVFIYRRTNIHSLLVYGFCNPTDARCGQWYTVKVDSSKVTLENRADLLQQAKVRVCAFDIETTKLPFKFLELNMT